MEDERERSDAGEEGIEETIEMKAPRLLLSYQHRSFYFYILFSLFLYTPSSFSILIRPRVGPLRRRFFSLTRHFWVSCLGCSKIKFNRIKN